MVTAFVGENAVYVDQIIKQEMILCVEFLHCIWKGAINRVKVRNDFSIYFSL